MRLTRGQHAAHWAFAAPALAMMALVNLVPVGQALWFGRDYARVFRDAQLLSVLGNTAVFTAVSVSLELLIGLGMALLLVKPFPGRGWVRAAVLIPWALPTAIMAMAWQWIFNSEYGVLGDLLWRLGLSKTPHIPWLASPGTAMAACILADVWKTAPFMALLIMSGLATIPAELYEAAWMDGAGRWGQFTMITLPLLLPTLSVAALFRAIHAFGIFDLVVVLTGGGPGGRTKMMAQYVCDTVFRYLDFGYGCTLTIVMALCLTATAGLIFLATGGRRRAA